MAWLPAGSFPLFMPGLDAGVTRAIDILRTDVIRTMKLGYASVTELAPTSTAIGGPALFLLIHSE